MATAYTSILKLALPVTGELSGTWGDVVNNNITQMVEEAVVGYAAVSSWTTNAHTLTTADGTTAESRCLMLDLSGTLTATGTLTIPAAFKKFYIVRNATTGGFAVNVGLSTGTTVTVPNGATVMLYADGTNTKSVAPSITNGFEVNLIASADTTVTLPTTGTLATLAGTETLTNKTLTSPDINGGTIDGATIGTTTPAAGTFTSVSDSGNLTFTGTGNRITGDFSSAAVANRVLFQTSTVDGTTSIATIPNGTGTTSAVGAYNSSNSNNSSFINLVCTATESSLKANITGTGTYLPMTFYTGGSERMRIDANGNVVLGHNISLQFKNSSGSARPTLLIYSDNNTYLDNYDGALYLRSNLGTSVNVVTLSSAGNFTLNTPNGGLGYGAGAGGTVTQATSKLTAVTLNKPTGQITMNNAALAAGAKVVFAVNNSLVSVSDVAVVTIGTIGGGQSYRASVPYTYAGGFYIMVENTTGGSLSEAIVVNFAIIKGATS